MLDDLWRLADHRNWNHGHEHRFILVMHVVTDHSAPSAARPGAKRQAPSPSSPETLVP